MKTIVLTPAAAKQLLALPEAAQVSIETALDRYAMAAAGDVKALKGSALFRLRVGSYRVVFDQDATTILAVYVGRRETTTYKKGRV